MHVCVCVLVYVLRCAGGQFLRLDKRAMLYVPRLLMCYTRLQVSIHVFCFFIIIAEPVTIYKAVRGEVLLDVLVTGPVGAYACMHACS